MSDVRAAALRACRARRRRGRSRGRPAPPRRGRARAGRPLLRGRVDGDVRGRRRPRRSRCSSYARDALAVAAHACVGAVRDAELDAGDPRARVPRRGLRAPLGAALVVLPRQVPLLDRARSCSSEIGARLAATVRRVRIRPPSGSPRPSSARCRSRRPRRSPRGLPFLIVRGEAKEYGTANRIEGDVLSGGAGLPPRGRRHERRGGRRGGSGAVREAGLECSNGGLRRRPRGGRRRRARARSPCACGRCFVPPTSRTPPKIPAKPAWLSGSDAGVTLTAT